MAKLKDLQFTGPLGNLSAFTMQGVDGVVVRTKGGASKEQIRTSPAFANTRRYNAEFGGRGTASKWVLLAFHPQRAVADNGLTGGINSRLTPVHKMDKVNVLGERSIELSKNPYALQGFSLNKYTHFDTIVRTPLSASLSREGRIATVDIPEIVPGINLYAPGKHPMYNITAALGIVPDLFYTKDFGYQPTHRAYDAYRPAIAQTEWHPVLQGSSATTLELSLAGPPPPDNAFTLMLTVGISFGVLYGPTTVVQAEHAGAAKVLAVG